MIKLQIYEFIFAIRGSKLFRSGVVDKLIKHKIGCLFYIHPWNDFGGPVRACLHQNTLGWNPKKWSVLIGPLG